MTTLPVSAPTPENENVNNGQDRPALPQCIVSDSCMVDSEANHDGVGNSSMQKGCSGVSCKDKAVNPSSDGADVGLGTHLDAGNRHLLGSSYDHLRPLLGMLAGSSKEDLEISERVLKIIEDKKELFKDLEYIAAPPSNKCQSFKDDLKKRILRPSDIDITFEKFPYFLRCRVLHLQSFKI